HVAARDLACLLPAVLDGAQRSLRGLEVLHGVEGLGLGQQGLLDREVLALLGLGLLEIGVARLEEGVLSGLEPLPLRVVLLAARSEERRVGKEWRAAGASNHHKK